MKKILRGILVFLLSGCIVKTDVQEIRFNEIGVSPEFEGRIYTITCSSSGGNAKRVKNACLKKMARTAHDKRYDYFSVFMQNHNLNNEIVPIAGQQVVTTTIDSNSRAYIHGSGGYAAGYGSTNGTVTSYVPTTEYMNVNTFVSEYGFVLIEEQDLGKWQNYYRVSDYYSE